MRNRESEGGWGAPQSEGERGVTRDAGRAGRTKQGERRRAGCDTVESGAHLGKRDVRHRNAGDIHESILPLMYRRMMFSIAVGTPETFHGRIVFALFCYGPGSDVRAGRRTECKQRSLTQRTQSCSPSLEQGDLTMHEEQPNAPSRWPVTTADILAYHTVSWLPTPVSYPSYIHPGLRSLVDPCGVSQGQTPHLCCGPGTAEIGGQWAGVIKKVSTYLGIA